MERFLHFALFVFLFFSVVCSSNAQTKRLKVYSVEENSKKNESVESHPNIPEKKNTTKFKQEIKKDANYLRISETTRDSISRIKIATQITNANEQQSDIQPLNVNAKKSINDNATGQDNVTYNKEIISENQSISTSERSPIKVTTSVNYKPSVLKEDIHPTTETTTTITPNKRIYLQQEAEDLQIEITQNANNTNYDLVQKQKLLEYIKTLLK